MKTKIFALLSYFLCFNANAQNTRYATLTSTEVPNSTGACYGSNGAYFNLRSANSQLLAGLNASQYTLTNYYPSNSFSPIQFIPTTQLSNYFSCTNQINVTIKHKTNPQLTYQGIIALTVLRIAPVPIHYYYETNGGGDSFYSKYYYDNLQFYGLTYAGVAFKAYDTPYNGTIPVFRHFNSEYVDHFYTVDYPDLSSIGYTYEGVEFYAYNYEYPGTVPVYRYFNPTLINHYYTTNFYEYGYSSYGYDYEGIEFYAFPYDFAGRSEQSKQLDKSKNTATNLELKTYPNPTRGLFTIENESNAIETILITDFLGKVVLDKKINNKKAEVDISNFSKGVYLLKAKSGDNVTVTKIMKE